MRAIYYTNMNKPESQSPVSAEFTNPDEHYNECRKKKPGGCEKVEDAVFA